MSESEHSPKSGFSIEQRDEFGPVPAEELGDDYRLHFDDVEGYSLAENGHLVDDSETEVEERAYVPGDVDMVKKNGTVFADEVRTYEAPIGDALCGQAKEIAEADEQTGMGDLVCGSCLRILKTRVDGSDADE